MAQDKNTEAQFVKSVTPFIASGMAFFAFLTDGGVLAALLVLAAFVLGWSVAKGRFPFGRSLQDHRNTGREVLYRLNEARIAEVLAVVNDNRKIEAIKMIRADTGEGLSEAKDAVDLLADLGADWNRKTSQEDD